MHFIEKRTISGLRCNNVMCPNEIRGPALGYFDGMSTYSDMAKAEGWTLWASRTSFAYCATCSMHYPRPGHKMRQI